MTSNTCRCISASSGVDKGASRDHGPPNKMKTFFVVLYHMAKIKRVSL
jgi:hypothetical protein